MVYTPAWKVVRSPLVFLTALAAVFCALFSGVSPSLASFSDVTDSDILYTPCISRLHENGYISGYTKGNGILTGEFGPDGTINRAEMTKIAVNIRVGEAVASGLSFFQEYIGITSLFDRLKDLLGSMGSFISHPFDDVRAYAADCVKQGTCDWYTSFICYAANKGIVQGTGNRLFEPGKNIIRLHALKILMTDDGAKDPEDEQRFKDLSAVAAARNAKPHCLAGAENYIRAMNKYSGDPSAADKLLKYALLADRLDLFGPQGGEHDCEVFGKAVTPRDRAIFLQKNLTRKEAARFSALSSLLESLRGDPASDPTVDTYSPRPPYSLPVYTEPADVPTEAETADDPGLTQNPPSPRDPNNPDSPQVPSPSCAGSSCAYEPDPVKGERWITPYLTAEKDYDGNVKLRTGPGASYAQLNGNGQIVPGEFIIAVGQPDVNKWQEVRYYDGGKAYVNMNYMKNASDHLRGIDKLLNAAGSSDGFSPSRLPRLSCAGSSGHKYDWMLRKGNEEKFLGYIGIQPNGEDKVFTVEGDFLKAYGDTKDICKSILGLPLSGAKDAARSSGGILGTTGTYQSFEHGRIYKSKHGTFPVYGNIYTLHENADGQQPSGKGRGTASPLGFPLSAPYAFTSSSKTGLLQDFEGGKVFWTEKDADKAELITGDSCEYANYGYTVTKTWPEGTASPDTGIAIRIAPKEGAGWTDGKCSLVFSKLDSSGKSIGTPAPFAKQTLNGVTTWKASFPNVTKSSSVSCEEQTYAILPSYKGASPLEKFTWSVGSEESCIEERLFKTSIPNAVIRSEAKNDAHILKTIPAMKTEITVIGKAVDGDYNDTYKTHRWYPVRCTDCKDANGQSVSKGYVVATVVHPEFIEFQDKGSQCGNRHQIKDRPIERVVLHGTAGSSLSGALSTFSDCTGAHFYVGRDGEMVQVATIDKLIWHAGYVANKSRTELVDNSQKNSYTSIGVEIANLGLIANQSDTNTKDIDTVFPNYWGMWKEGLHWGTFKDQSGQKDLDIDSKKWQFYTDEQYKSLDKLLSYVEESTGIPYKVSLYKDEDDTSNNTAYYYHPLSPIDAYAIAKTPDNKKKAYEQQTKILNDYLNNLYFFQGVVDHHANAGKWDTGPAFDICNKYLNFQNIQNFCKN